MLSSMEVVIVKELSNELYTCLNCLAAFATCTRLDHFLHCFASFSVVVILQSKNLTPDIQYKKLGLMVPEEGTNSDFKELLTSTSQLPGSKGDTEESEEQF